MGVSGIPGKIKYKRNSLLLVLQDKPFPWIFARQISKYLLD